METRHWLWSAMSAADIGLSCQLPLLLHIDWILLTNQIFYNKSNTYKQINLKPKNFDKLILFGVYLNKNNRSFYSSQCQIGHATTHMWEWGWGWLMLSLCKHIWRNSYMGSKIVQFLRKMDGPSQNLDKANFSPKKKGTQCATFGCSNTFYGPNVLPTSFPFIKFMYWGMYFC